MQSLTKNITINEKCNANANDDCTHINPIDELLKAIEIVHGRGSARPYRYLIMRILENHKYDCVEWDGIEGRGYDA